MESHEQDLLDEVQDQEKVWAIQDDYTRVDFDPATRTLLDFAVKLTTNIHGMEKSDIEDLRIHGFSDEDILDAVHLTSYFNYVNRILDALGAEPEPGMRFPSPNRKPESTAVKPTAYRPGNPESANDGGTPA